MRVALIARAATKWSSMVELLLMSISCFGLPKPRSRRAMAAASRIFSSFDERILTTTSMHFGPWTRANAAISTSGLGRPAGLPERPGRHEPGVARLTVCCSELLAASDNEIISLLISFGVALFACFANYLHPTPKYPLTMNAMTFI